jgi:hypothetical protein
MNDEFAEIRYLATRFRNAIEACDPAGLPIGMQNFPLGACGDAALLLAKYLVPGITAG